MGRVAPCAPLLAAVLLSAAGHGVLFHWWSSRPPLVRHPDRSDSIILAGRMPASRAPDHRQRGPVAHAGGRAASTPEPTRPAPPDTDVDAGLEEASSGTDSPGARLFWTSDQVDMRALPVRPPDTSLLTGMTWPGRVLRLRLAIDADGLVVDVQLDQDDPDLAQQTQPLLEMFRRMSFVPARRHGRNVASLQIIEVDAATF